ncbi:MAG: NADH-quinone oxidoreductase subunit NuoN [Hyphomicrobiaceae bacterium]|nr:NADH-quinone oxidoreductase subunit NuoN [Hyphomicrobiaceae bacterium]
MSDLLSYAALPEIILAVGAMALLMQGAFQADTEEAGIMATWLAIGLLIVAGVVMLLNPVVATGLFDDAFIIDRYTRFMKILVLVGSAGALLLSFQPFGELKLMKFEYPVLVLLATVGMMMMISANDLIALYIGLELQSLALYVVAAFRRDSVRSSEAGLKYFVLGALSSGMLLYGASLIYGFAGSTSFPAIAGVVKAANIGVIVGLVFVMVGLAFKVSAVPFHMWTPDVYEGAPTPVTAFFAAAPKVAAMALMVRTLTVAFPGIAPQWQQIVVFIAIASMLLGSFAAIGQTNIKRLMAYSSIGHVGFALVGLAANNAEGVQGVLIYMAIYLVMTLGTFACILAMRRNDGPVEEIEELSGLAENNLGMAFALGMLMFSLAGIPPLAGFWGKFYVIAAAVKADMLTLAVIAVLASVVAAFYYIRIVIVMFVKEPKEKFLGVDAKTGAVMALAAIFVVFFIVYPSPLVDAAAQAAKSLRL